MLNTLIHKQKEDTMLQDKHSKLDYIQSLKEQYKKSKRSQKTHLINVAIAFTGYNRKYLARLFRSNRDLLKQTKFKRKRKRIYDSEVRLLVLSISRV